MKILWFTNTPSNASLEFGYNNFAGGWISSLETLVNEKGIYKLGICFFYYGDSFKKLTKDKTIYYGIPIGRVNTVKRIIDRQLVKLYDENSSIVDEVIDEFKPDLVHVFGTEMGYGKLLMNRSERVLFHLQGLIAPYCEVFFPLGFSKLNLLRYAGLGPLLRGITPVNTFKYFKKRADREIAIIRHWKYFVGRTEWDRNYIQLINPRAIYFHCEEVLRKEFFLDQWHQPSELANGSNIVIGTTISSFLYKGLDLIYKVMDLLTNYRIQWKVFGISDNDSLINLTRKTICNNDKSYNIEFFGQINACSLINELKTCHFYVHPSYIDNSPNSICEAMLLGMPILSSCAGGIKSLIIDKETGFLFNPYDKYDLSGLLVYLISNYEKAKIAGKKARETAITRHSPESVLDRLSVIYNSVYNDKPGA